MTVLKIIGVGLFILFLLYIVNSLNKFTYKKYKVEFFTYGYLITYAFIYGLSYYGYNWYKDALAVDGDIYNGIIIMLIAAIIFILAFIINVKSSSFLFAIVITVLQFIIYLPAAFIGVLALVAFLAFLSQTKPVYNLN